MDLWFYNDWMHMYDLFRSFIQLIYIFCSDANNGIDLARIL